MKLAVHFGAGNIGRGFIGLMLHEANYRVTFVDVDPAIVDAINARKRYSVRQAAADPQPVVVDDIAALHAADSSNVIRAIAEADVITTAVGPAGLRAIAPALSRGLESRSRLRSPVVVIACENLIGASEELCALVVACGNPENAAVFANCAVDRIVPLQQADASDPLSVTVEPFHEWIIDASAFKTTLAPSLPGAVFAADLRPFIERKLYTVNTAHASLAYLGHRSGLRFVHEAMQSPDIRRTIEGALAESGAGLVQRHHLDPAAHAAYARKVLGRFDNERLGDDIDRVARSPIRKLGRDERLIAPARHAAAAGVSPECLASIIASALRYHNPADAEASELQELIRAEGISAALTRISGLAATHPLHREVLSRYRQC